MRNVRPLHVAVIGASLAGIFAAAAASNAGCSVTLIERDQLPDTPQSRRGVPQSEQSHILLFRGLLAMEELFPGIRQELTDHGVPHFQMGRLPTLGSDGWAPVGDYGFDLLCVSRPLLEHVARQRVLNMEGVRLLSGTRARALHREGEQWRLEVQPADEQTPEPDSAERNETAVVADVVVDASGRSSRLPRWLQELGVPSARTTTVDAQVGYATRRYSSDNPPEPGVLIMASAQNPRGCMIGPVENGQWVVSTVGVGEHRPGRDEDAFLEHLGQLPYPPALHRVQQMTPVGDIAVHRQTANVRHRYEDVRNWPTGLLATGDSLCAVNPIYGQGMTVAACQGLLLRDVFLAARRGVPVGKKVQRRLARAANLPWTMATSQDRLFLTSSEPPRAHEALVSGWGTQVARLAMNGDLKAAMVMQRVGHLMTSPAALFSPAMLLAVTRAQLRQRRSSRRLTLPAEVASPQAQP